MAGSTFQPPIHLDPSQDNNQQTSFINQNFQTIASTLETNSFRIVTQGITSLTTSGAGTSIKTIPHNLGFSPIPFVYLTGQTRTSGSLTITNANIPFPTWGFNFTSDTILATATSSGIARPLAGFQAYFDCVADTTNLYVFLINSTASSGTFNIQYYLVQQPSS